MKNVYELTHAPNFLALTKISDNKSYSQAILHDSFMFPFIQMLQSTKVFPSKDFVFIYHLRNQFQK